MLISPSQAMALSGYAAGMTRSVAGQRSAVPPWTSAGISNRLLRALPKEALEELRPLLERVPLKRRQVLHERNIPLTHAHFIERGAASLLARTGDGGSLECGTIGSYDLAGLPLVL